MPSTHRHHKNLAATLGTKKKLLYIAAVTLSPVLWFWVSLVEELNSLDWDITEFGDKQNFSSNNNTLSTPDESAAVRIRKAEADEQQEGDPLGTSSEFFVPGSLSLTPLETFQRCFADPEQYRQHFRGRLRTHDGHARLDRFRRYMYQNTTLCSVSRRFGVAYHQIEKSGSSTVREVMKADYSAKEYQHCPETQPARLRAAEASRNNLNNQTQPRRRRMHHFTVVREPISRFVSSYNEVLRRFTKRAFSDRSYVPLQYARFARRYWNVSIYKHYDRLSRNQNNTAFLDEELAALEDFVQDYDAADPFDTHLRLQVPRMLNFETGRPVHLDHIMDMRDLVDQLHALSRRWRHGNDTVSVPSKVYGRFAIERNAFNVSRLSVAARRKICQLSALDYCCLNYPLPPECADQVQCRWVAPVAENKEEPWITAESPYPVTLPQGLV